MAYPRLMTRNLLAGVAALSLLAAAGTAHATAESDDYVCAVVHPPKDKDGAPGYLNVREKPNTKSKVKMKVEWGTILIINIGPEMDLFKDWVYTTAAFSDGPTTNGWVSKKYLNKLYDIRTSQYTCPDRKPQSEPDIEEAPPTLPSPVPFIGPPRCVGSPTAICPNAAPAQNISTATGASRRTYAALPLRSRMMTFSSAPISAARRRKRPRDFPLSWHDV